MSWQRIAQCGAASRTQPLEKSKDETAKAAISNKNCCPFNSKSSVAWQEQLSRVFEGVEREKRERGGKMKLAWANPSYYYPSGCTEPILAEAALPLGSQLLPQRRSTKRDFPLSTLETRWRVSAGKPSHMCLRALGPGSVGEHKAAALIKFP